MSLWVTVAAPGWLITGTQCCCPWLANLTLFMHELECFSSEISQLKPREINYKSPTWQCLQDYHSVPGAWMMYGSRWLTMLHALAQAASSPLFTRCTRPTSRKGTANLKSPNNFAHFQTRHVAKYSNDGVRSLAPYAGDTQLLSDDRA